jgi:transcriptional regulator with XRE-family HTH domain
MAKVTRTYSRYTQEASILMGKMIRLGRKERKFTLQDLADRAGISRGLLQRIEKGDLGCEIGAVFEIASLVGIKLFEADRSTMHRLNESLTDKLALLPKYVRNSTRKIDDDF